MKSPFSLRLIKSKGFSRFSDLGLATKLMIVIYSGIFTIFLFLSAMMTLLSHTNNIADQKRQGREFLSGGLSIVREEMQYISGIADYLGLASDIQNMMADSGVGPEPAAPSETLAAVISLKYAVSVVIYDRAGRVLDYASIDGSSGPLDQPADDPSHPLYPLMYADQTFAWQYIRAGDSLFMERDFSPKLCLWKRVQSSKDKSIIGATAVSIDIRKLLDAGPRLGPAYRSIIVVNEQNEEVFNRSGISISQDTIAMLNTLAPSADHQVLIDNTRYRAFFTKVGNTDLKLFYFLPIWDIRQDMNSYAVYIIVAMALFMLLLIPLFLFITKSIIKPLNLLTVSMEKFSHGDFASRVNFLYSDEVGRLGKVFNSMVIENKRLINSNYVLELKEKEAELASLQSQMNPHFLYNAVNSIQWLAVKNSDKAVADLIYSLGRIFRFSLGVKQKMSTVRQEIELLYNYLKLQRQCYGNRFEYSVDAENGVGEIYIPRLSIQPLVENSILHGVENSSQKVEIAVKVRFSPDREMLLLEVSDNGPGISPEMLALLPDNLLPADLDGKPESNGLALKNISDRLKIVYGNRYSFTIASVPYERTTVKIVVPILLSPEAAGEKTG
ncbi:MAG: histidine kinase [Peptococcaceae bacterium]|jgi:sensor histidine kinase YesM|nr:histidine kinase [Peptococcaceae bacterium]